MASKSRAISRFIVILFFSFFLSGMAASPPLVGRLAPPFELETVGGRTINLSDFKGASVILNFWATWCVPCIKELPEFNKAHQSLEDNGVKIIAINFAEPRKRVAKFIQDHHLSLPVLLDGFGDTSAEYEVINLPVTYFITPDGIIRGKILGGGLTKEIIESKINQLKE